MASDRDFIAVTEHIDRAGTIIMWTMRDETHLSFLAQHWAGAGLDPDLLPSMPSAATALRRAVGELRESGRTVQPFGRGNGLAVVRVKTVMEGGEEELEFETLCKAKLDKVERLVVKGNPKLCLEIEEMFEHYQETLETIDLSSWLIKLIEGRLDGVAMRESGGVYFVPSTKLAELDAIVDALKAATQHSFYRFPCLRSEDAVQAIIDSIAAQAEAELRLMQKEMTEEKCGALGWKNRVAKVGVIEDKVARYEGLLSLDLDKIRERLDEVRAELTVAIIKAEQAEAKEDGTQPALASP